MSDTTTDNEFSAQQMRTLASVLDELVPAREDASLPGAGTLGIADPVAHALRATPPLLSMIAHGLSDLDALAQQRHGADFAALARTDKLQLLNEQGFILPLTLHAYAGYYRHPRVLAALGLPSHPPHPTGYVMKPNDLSLLDPVRARTKGYRA